MSCDRCVDIHEAQRLGVVRYPCECDCHMSSGTGTDYPHYWPTCTCGQNSTLPCPLHGLYGRDQWVQCFCISDNNI